jgi:hypothetical protein
MINTIAEFDRWLELAEPGDKAVYHVGRLANDRVAVQPFTAAQLDTLALAVLAAADRGQVAPLSRRLGDNRFEYTVTAGRFRGSRAPRLAATRRELPIAA